MRTLISIGLALVVVPGATFLISAAADAAERFTFARPPAPESTVDPTSGRLRFDFEPWSTLGVTIAEFDRAPAVLADVRHDQRGTN